MPIAGTTTAFPVHRIYCVGRNFAEHAREMGAEPSRGSPVFFMKPADAVLVEGDVPYPGMTADLHHEVELVVALGRDCDGVIDAANALELVFGYGVGLDLTRRDLQAAGQGQAAALGYLEGLRLLRAAQRHRAGGRVRPRLQPPPVAGGQRRLAPAGAACRT